VYNRIVITAKDCAGIRRNRHSIESAGSFGEEGYSVVTVVLSIPDEVYAGILKYADGDQRNAKFLIVTGAKDYLAKREARTRRAERQKASKGEK